MSTRVTMTCRRCAVRRGFTLIEVLVVVSIMVILLGLVIGVGVSVFKNQRAAATRGVLTALDRALDEYITSTNAAPAYDYRDYEQVPGPDVAAGAGPAGSGRFFAAYQGATHPTRPDAAVFIKQAYGVGEVQKIVTSMGERFLRPTIGPSGVGDPLKASDTTPSVVDAWATDEWPNHFEAPSSPSRWYPLNQQLIYYVHPKNALAQDLYGKCVNGRPYFLSAGDDLRYGLKSDFNRGTVDGFQGDYTPAQIREAVEGTLKDNLTSYPVGDALLTQDFFDTYRQ